MVEEEKMKRGLLLVIIIALAFSLAACAPGSNEMKNSADEEGEVAGFLKGIWHGIISPITFIISLFNKSIGIYEVHNNGGWYNFGFLIGVMIIFGGTGGASGRKSSS